MRAEPKLSQPAGFSNLAGNIVVATGVGIFCHVTGILNLVSHLNPFSFSSEPVDPRLKELQETAQKAYEEAKQTFADAHGKVANKLASMNAAESAASEANQVFNAWANEHCRTAAPVEGHADCVANAHTLPEATELLQKNATAAEAFETAKGQWETSKEVLDSAAADMKQKAEKATKDSYIAKAKEAFHSSREWSVENQSLIATTAGFATAFFLVDHLASKKIENPLARGAFSFASAFVAVWAGANFGFGHSVSYMTVLTHGALSVGSLFAIKFGFAPAVETITKYGHNFSRLVQGK